MRESFCTKRHLFTLAISFGLLSQACVATADAQDPKPSGATWWQWALSIPASVNPLEDPTGADCMVGQQGSVWFLAGVFGGSTAATRRCSVPDDRSLFFPVINNFNVNSPGVCGQVGNLSVKDLRALVAPLIDGAKNLAVELDGKPIHNLERVQSDPFSVALPADNLFVAPCNGDSPAGVYSPAVDDGIYVTINKLRAGIHTLHLHAENPSKLFGLDVMYTLNVIHVSSK
jgi:hypothetical protein